MTLVTTKTVLPGKSGTLKELEKYEDQLVCVRYRYDPEKQRKIKTVEIIVDSKTIKSNKKRIPFNKKVFVKIDYPEKKPSKGCKIGWCKLAFSKEIVEVAIWGCI